MKRISLSSFLCGLSLKKSQKLYTDDSNVSKKEGRWQSVRSSIRAHIRKITFMNTTDTSVTSPGESRSYTEIVGATDLHSNSSTFVTSPLASDANHLPTFVPRPIQQRHVTIDKKPLPDNSIPSTTSKIVKITYESEETGQDDAFVNMSEENRNLTLAALAWADAFASPLQSCQSFTNSIPPTPTSSAGTVIHHTIPETNWSIPFYSTLLGHSKEETPATTNSSAFETQKEQHSESKEEEDFLCSDIENDRIAQSLKTDDDQSFLSLPELSSDSEDQFFDSSEILSGDEVHADVEITYLPLPTAEEDPFPFTGRVYSDEYVDYLDYFYRLPTRNPRKPPSSRHRRNKRVLVAVPAKPRQISYNIRRCQSVEGCEVCSQGLEYYHPGFELE